MRLYLASRRALTCLLVLVAFAVVLRTALHWMPRSGLASRQLPLTIQAGAAALIGVTTRSPFGEPERATGRWLPLLRLGTVMVLAGAAVGALAAGAASAHLAGGTLGMLRDLAGLTGIALRTAALLGGALAWVGPLAYLVVTLHALQAAWTTPWVWPARPPHDRGAPARPWYWPPGSWSSRCVAPTTRPAERRCGPGARPAHRPAPPRAHSGAVRPLPPGRTCGCRRLEPSDEMELHA